MTPMMSFASTIIADRSDLKWLIAGSETVGYLGWLRRGNVGDEAMYCAFREFLDNDRVLPVPLTKLGRRFAKGSKVELMVVGGGTLLGRPEWNVRIREAIRQMQPSRIITLGTGVVSPGSEIGQEVAETALKETARILRDFDRVTVRGPRSVRTLQDFGIEAEALGDLALLHNKYSGQLGAQRAPEILVNLVNSGGHGVQLNSTMVLTLLKTLSLFEEDGYRVRFFCMEKSDESLISKTIGGRFEILPYVSDPDSLVDLIRGAKLVISERLHGNILSAALGVPFLAMPYMDKVLDFVESIDCLDRVIPTNSFQDYNQLKSICVDALGNRERQSRVDSAVDRRVFALSSFLNSPR